MTSTPYGLRGQHKPAEDRPFGSHLDVTNSPLLSSSDSLRYNELAPYKAPASDTTSLCQKKRHHAVHNERVHRSNSVSYSGSAKTQSVADGIDDSCRTVRSKSVPCLPSRNLSMYDNRLFSSTRRATGTHWRSSYSSWVFPSKASPTRGLSTVSPMVKHYKRGRKNDSAPSPAMITLRRATNPLCQSTDITFFPPPTFSNSKPSLVSHFLSTLTGESQHVSVVGKSIATRRRKPDHVLAGTLACSGSQPSLESDKAGPAITEVTLEPTRSDSSSEPIPFRPRRCSTKYTTATSVYEVIWDENDSPTDASTTPSQSDIVTDPNARKQSVAMEQLEAQLFKSVIQTRRESALSPRGSLTDLSHGSFRRLSFQSLLDRSLSRLINEAALQGLPRSKASKASPRPRRIAPVDELIPDLVDDTDSMYTSSSVGISPSQHPPWAKYVPFESSSLWTTSRLGGSVADGHGVACDVGPTEQIRDGNGSLQRPKTRDAHEGTSAHSPIYHGTTTSRYHEGEAVPLLDAAY